MEQVPKKPENLPNDGADSDKKPFFNRKGIPPTTVSIAGTIGSIVGIRNIDKRWGAIMLATSSFGDLLDGKMARGEIDIEMKTLQITQTQKTKKPAKPYSARLLIISATRLR